MKSGRRLGAVVLLALIGVVGCGPGATTPAQPANSQTQVAEPRPTHTVTFITHVEPNSLSEHRAMTGTGSVPADAIRLFNARLFLGDEHGVSHPYLVERAPELNTDGWRVFPDGRMETTYTLRSGLTWHDGAPLTAEDFVLGWRVLKKPDFGVADLLPAKYMDDVVAVDARTILVRWNSTFPRVDSLNGRDWSPLPSHILANAFETQQPEVFASHPYWTREYVGLGPFRVERREPGAFIEGVAFDGHALGRPKIDRIQVRFTGDPNTAVANLLAGQADMVLDLTLGFEQGTVLKRAWDANHGGEVLLSPDKLRYVQVQAKPEFASPREILDVRVRKALAFAIDKQALIDGLLDGNGRGAEGMVPPLVDYYDAAVRELTKYPYDLRQTEQLMQSAGLTKGVDGFYAGAEHFSPELRSTAGGQESRENAIVADVWRRAGIDVQSRLLSEAEDNDRQLRATFPTLASANSGLDEDTLFVKLYSPNVATAANRWAGSNRGGWINTDYDRFYQQMTTSLDRTARDQAITQLAKLVSEELPLIPMYYNYNVQAHLASLQGPHIYATGGEATWNVENWVSK